MEDEDDIYGFGALSDMFDNRASAAPMMTASNGVSAASRAVVEPKRLDVAAMSRFWWSERRLSEFRRGPQRNAKEYHHVAVKFDGMRVDGGLGSVFLVPNSRSESSGRMEEGGLLWVQAQASDSNAQARRKKEFQDITNRLPLRDRQDAMKTPKGSSKLTATVFLSSNEILDAKETRVQNTVQGITFTLRSGPQFEIVFMPGPFYDARNRDEMLEAFVRQQVDDVFSPESSPQAPKVPQGPSSSRATSRASSPDDQRSQPSSREQTPRNSPSSASTRIPTNSIVQDPIRRQDTNRELIRRYAQMDKSSAEAIAIAQKIYSSSTYQVGPLATRMPDFSTDSAYRKRTCTVLDRKINKLKREWALNEQERELGTRARCASSRDGIFQYTDSITLESISSSAYRERYTKFVEAEQPEAHPLVRMFEPRSVPASVNNRLNSPSLQESSTRLDRLSPSLSVSPVRSHDEECKLLGINIRHSALVDAAVVLKWQAMALPASEDFSEWRDIIDESVLSEARTNLAARVSGVIQKVSVRPTDALIAPPEDIHYDAHPASSRSANRRRSLDHSSLEDVRAQFGRSGQYSSDELDSPSHTKRRRSDGDANPTVGRRRRRQSLVGTLNLSLLEEEKVEESEPSANSDVIQPMDSMCPLCCDADAVVVMKPCGHSVCRACWNRLIRVQDVSEKGVDTRQCPWDRADAVERTTAPRSSSALQLESL